MLPIPAGNPSEWTGPTGNNTYLLTGRVPALIDAGVGHPAHLDAIERALAGRELELVLVTHSHVDHVAGLPALLDRWPHATVRPGAAPLVDGESIAAGDGNLIALHTPGHSPDHFCFLDRDRREIYCGDLMRIGGTVVIPGSRGGNLRAYLESLRRIRDLAPRRLWPGHGRPVDNPAALIAQYLAHRERREAEILSAVRSGRGIPAEIVTEVYEGLAPGLHAGAAESVVAHLNKLVEDGAVEYVDGRYVPRA